MTFNPEAVDDRLERAFELIRQAIGARPDPGGTPMKLQRIEASLAELHRKVDLVMAKVKDVETLLDQVNTVTNTIAAKVTAEQAEIAALKAQIATGTPVSQEQLDAIAARLGTVATSLEAIAADPADPIPSPLPGDENPPVPGSIG